MEWMTATTLKFNLEKMVVLLADSIPPPKEQGDVLRVLLNGYLQKDSQVMTVEHSTIGGGKCR